MSARKVATVALAGALLAGGAGAAIAAATKDDDAGKAEEKLLADAAKRLNVTPGALRDALGGAFDAQLDEAVEDGKLTQRQADAIKARRRASGRVLGGPLLGGPPGLKGPHLHLGGGPHLGAGLADLAGALGITPGQLRERLRDGKSIADIAKAEGRSLADVRAAMKAAAKKRLDKAVQDGDITRAQADDMLEHLGDRLANLDRPLARRGRHRRALPPLARRGRHRHRHALPPPVLLPGGARPGSFTPDDEVPAVLLAPEGVPG